MREVISTPDAPKAIGPYSQAIKAAGLLFTCRSGRVGSSDRPGLFREMPPPKPIAP